MKERYKIPVACYLVLLQNEQVLLLKRQNTGYADGMYSLIAWHKEENESVSDSMVREAYEEAGIILHKEDLEVWCVMNRKAGKYDYIDYFFIARNYLWEITNLEPEKCAELKFFSTKNLPENTLEYIRLGIETCFSTKNILEYGWEKS